MAPSSIAQALNDPRLDSGRAEGQRRITNARGAGRLPGMSGAEMEALAARQYRQGPGGLSSEADFLPGGSRAPVIGVSQGPPVGRPQPGSVQPTERREGNPFEGWQPNYAPRPGEAEQGFAQIALSLVNDEAGRENRQLDPLSGVRDLQRVGSGVLGPPMSFNELVALGPEMQPEQPATTPSDRYVRGTPSGGGEGGEGGGTAGEVDPDAFFDPVMAEEARRLGLELVLGTGKLDRSQERLLEDAALMRPHMERLMRQQFGATAENVASRGFHGSGSGVMASRLGEVSADQTFRRSIFDRDLARGMEDIEAARQELIQRIALEGGESVLRGAGRTAEEILAALGF